MDQRPMRAAVRVPCKCVLAVAAFALAIAAQAQKADPIDPGVRGGTPDAGGPLPGLTSDEALFFGDGLARFVEVETVTGGSNTGLGPRFNSNQCSSCHAQPAIGGTSPAQNPLLAVAVTSGAQNALPWFIVTNGPVREARFKLNANGSADGGVHDLFVITGRSDAPGCAITQPVFTPAGNALTGQGGNSNIIFRIPTPLFGAGLIEAISDTAILANMQANSSAKQALGIGGVANLSGNDGTITRFGWKAQNKSLLMFAGEAYNVEMGISNQLFPQERDETPSCNFQATPNDTDNFTPTGGAATQVLSDIEAFADFTRMLAPPVPGPQTASTLAGSAVFSQIGCSLCHTPSFTTGSAIASGSATVPSAALSNQTANLFSDLLLHNMGSGLADGITQGGAGPRQFRTAPLWGLGQRVFFLHDGRTSNLVEAINAHSSAGSEANGVVEQFQQLDQAQAQDLLNFLRSL